MTQVDQDSTYADVTERALYNGELGGMSLDGRAYHYVNALEIRPEVTNYRIDHEYVETKRVGWFECACCPTNIARLVASIGAYIASTSDDAVWIHQYISSAVEAAPGGTAVVIETRTDYPWDGLVRFSIKPASPAVFSLNLRVPDRCDKYSVTINRAEVDRLPVDRGYMSIEREWRSGDSVELAMTMTVRFIRVNARVAEAAGKVAVQRGPIVYCFEQSDDEPDLHQLTIDPALPVRVERDDSLVSNTIVIDLGGYRDADEGSDELYHDYGHDDLLSDCTIRAIPFYQRGNRVDDEEMRVWLRVRQ
jgi:DUF1680 family protein